MLLRCIVSCTALFLCTSINAQVRVEFPLRADVKQIHGIRLSPDGDYIAVRFIDRRERWSLQINDMVLGPYDASWNEEYDGSVSLPVFGTDASAAQYMFWFRDEYFFYVQEGKTRHGPFDRVRELSSCVRGTDFQFSYLLNRMWYFQQGGKRSGPYPAQRKPVAVCEKQLPLRSIVSNEQWYVMHSGVELGPFERVAGLNAASSGVALWGRRNNQWSIVTHNAEYGPFDVAENWDSLAEICLPVVSANPHTTAFRYKSSNGGWYVGVNDKQFGPFYSEASDVFAAVGQPVLIGGDAAFWFSLDGLWYVQLPSGVRGPYQRPGGTELLSGTGGSYAYTYEAAEGSFTAIGEAISGPYDAVLDMGYANGLWWYVYVSSRGQWLQIEEKSYGPFDSVAAPVFCFETSRYVFRHSEGEFFRVTTDSGASFGPYVAAEPVLDSSGRLIIGYVDAEKLHAGILRLDAYGYIRR